jgi:integrase
VILSLTTGIRTEEARALRWDHVDLDGDPDVRRDFRALCKKAGIEGVWTPRELRHTFVSVMSASGVAVEEIARLAGHASSRTTEVVYRRELRPVITTGAEVMDQIFQPKHRRGASAEATR